MSNAIHFYFDVISHNAYLAWCRLPEIAARHGREIEPVPILFAAMLEHTGARGPGEIPAKGLWMLKNVLRKAALDGVALAPPASHPFNPLAALRAVQAVTDPALRRALVDRLLRAVWAESRPVTKPEQVAALAAECGLDGAALLPQISAPDIKDALHRNAAAAIRAGIFGVPTMRVGDELFWGYDDLPFLDAYLGGRDPLGGTDLRPWLAVRPSAQRR